MSASGKCVVLVAAIAAASLPVARAGAIPAIIPRPSEVVPGDGVFMLDGTTAIVAAGRADPEARTLAECLRPALGRDLALVDGNEARDHGISLLLGDDPAGLGPEGYRLEVTPARIVIRAAEPAGLFYGIQTLRQLLPPAVYGNSPGGDARWPVPCLTVTDRPRFAWRGLLLDPARHFMPKEHIRKLIAVMAVHKLNSLQLHLTDDQGWRIEIRKFPRLTGIGAWRGETLIGHSREQPQRFDGKRHGGWYSQEDIRELVAFARQQHVNLVPEIEMPGHAGAALAAYPELGCFPERPRQVWTRWGVNPDIFNPNDRTIAFLRDVLLEVMELFPSPFIHVGGDEAVKDWWKECPEVQRRIRELGLKNEEELQGWLIRQMDRFLAEHGRRLIGWDEILQGGLASGAAVMSWRGNKGGIAAAQAGHDVVMAPSTHTYFDYYQGPKDREPLAIGGHLPIEKVFGFELIPPGINSEQARHILGGQGQLWTEYIPTPQHADYMTWPRAAALAEILWTGAAEKDTAGFLRRLRAHLPRLDAMGVKYRPLDAPQ